MSFAERPILVTGCSSGIGRATAQGLHRRGYRVIATARSAQAVDELAAEGLTAVRLDLNESASIQEAFHKALELTSGRLYGLFNNAAFGQPGAVEDLTREVLRAQFETNLFGTHELTRMAIAHMRQSGGGRIIQNSSVLGLVALPFRGAYNASKFALEGLTDTLRLELAGSGIHVSLIEPGPIRSRFRANAYQKFIDHIDADQSHFRDTYQRMVHRLTRPGAPAPFTLGPEAVLAKVCHALESPSPRARYYVTTPTHLLGHGRRLLSTRLLDWVLSRISRDENR